MKTLLLTGGVVVVLVVAGLAYLAKRPGSSPTPAASTSTPSVSPGAQTVGQTVVKYTDRGFEPRTVTIKSGQEVLFENDSSRDLQVDSNPHPIHTDETELNIGAVPSGKQVAATLTRAGSWGYHNHLNPSDTGTVVVQP